MRPSDPKPPIPLDQGTKTQLLSGVIGTSVGAVLLTPALALLYSYYLASKTPMLTRVVLAIGLPLTLMALLFGIPGVRDLRRALVTRRVMRYGVPAQAEVLDRKFTKRRYNQYYVIRLRLRVLPRDAAPYEVTIDWLSGAETLMVTPGRLVPVKVDPRNPRAVVVNA
jgi:hypothetical protein